MLRGRDRTFATLLWLMSVGPLLAACAFPSHQIGPDRPIPIAEDVAWVAPLTKPDLVEFRASPPADQATMRNQIITARMYVADLEYYNFESQLTREMQDEGILATAVNLGLTSSATLIGGAATKTILSGVATGVTGLDKAYSEKELLANTIQALQTQMRADRKAQSAIILAKMLQDNGTGQKTVTPIDQYSLPMALSDTARYYQAGTVASALIGLTKTVSNAETNAETAAAQAGPNPSQVAQAHVTARPLTAPAALPASVGAPQSSVTPAPTRPATTPSLPQRSKRTEPACTPSIEIPLACPPLTPNLQLRRKNVSDGVKKLQDLLRLTAIAQTMGVPVPVATTKCIKRDIVNHVEQACDDAAITQVETALASPTSKK